MKLTIIYLCLLTAFMIFAACSNSNVQSDQRLRNKIQGVWTIESMDQGIAENRRTTVPPAFMIFITENHYSAIRDFSDPPREDWGPGVTPSTEGFMADSGHYELEGSDFIVYQKAAMIPNMTRGGSMTFTCEMEGTDTLILSPQYDKMVIPGMNLAPSADGKMGYGDMATRYRFRRLE